jgi:hypothetical protein
VYNRIIALSYTGAARHRALLRADSPDARSATRRHDPVLQDHLPRSPPANNTRTYTPTIALHVICISNYCIIALYCTRARPGSAHCSVSAPWRAIGNTAPWFGSAEANCETPPRVLDVAIARAKEIAPGAPLVLHAGDFCAFMDETPCNASAPQGAPGSSQFDLLACIVKGYGAVKQAFPAAPVLPVLGNHDTVVMNYSNADGTNSSGAAFVGSRGMHWLYSMLADIWALPANIGCSDADAGRGEEDSEFSCVEARRTLLLGGYYATRLPNLGGSSVNVTVVALNTNYWAPDNAAMSNPFGEAAALGETMFIWALERVARAAQRGDKVLVLGHIPPYHSQWVPGRYRQWITALTPYYRQGLQLAHFFGHMHTDEWMVARACDGGGGGGGVLDECAGEPLGVMVTIPGNTVAYPAANPSFRMLEFSPEDFALREMHTYTADLHLSNREGTMRYDLLYSFREAMGIGPDTDITPRALAAVVQRLDSAAGEAIWARYRGNAAGTIYCKGWAADNGFVGSADSECPQPCNGDCKKDWIRVLNGTAQNAAPPGPFAPPTKPAHYADPFAAAGCMQDELNISLPGIGGSFCSPACGKSGGGGGSAPASCPQDVARGVLAMPRCVLEGRPPAAAGQQALQQCALQCAGDSDCGAAGRGGQPVCSVLGKIGICTYQYVAP